MAKSLSFLGKHQKQRAKSGQDIFSQERPSIHILIYLFLQNMGRNMNVVPKHHEYWKFFFSIVMTALKVARL